MNLSDLDRFKSSRDQALADALKQLDMEVQPKARPFTAADWEHIENMNALQRDVNKSKVMQALTALTELSPAHILVNLGYSQEVIKALTIAQAALEIVADEIVKPPVKIIRIQAPAQDYTEYCQARKEGKYFPDPRD